jgi:hypothetical protein
MRRQGLLAFALTFAVVFLQPIVLHGHSGPPFPILSNRIAGAYDISIWSDPDVTDDKSAAGKFWVVLALARSDGTIPDGTRAHLTIQALDRKVPALVAAAEPVDGRITRQFAAVLMDHEGPYSVRVAVDGPLGRAEVETKVDATYDLRPPIGELIVFLFPFTALGVLWVVMLRRRRAIGARRRLPGQAVGGAESKTGGTGASGT